MFRIGRDNLIINFNELYNDTNNIFVFVTEKLIVDVIFLDN